MIKTIISKDFVNQANKLVTEGYISCKTLGNYRIYNYTQKTQIQSYWNNITETCRGLILDDNDNVIALPIKKFHNHDQIANFNELLINNKFKVYDKLDGSLGILYKDAYGNHKISTRGSMTSEQAIYATDNILPNYLDKINKFETIYGDNYTLCFEIIYPINRIVVDYGNQEKLVLLAIVDKRDGTELDIDSITVDFEKAKSFNSINSLEHFTNSENNTDEGFVIIFDNGTKAKYKFERYKEIHKLISGLSKTNIIKAGKENKLVEFKDSIPDEFLEWFDNCMEEIQMEYNTIYNNLYYNFDSIDKQYLEDKKTFAIYINSNDRYKKINSGLFSIYNNNLQALDNIIWNEISDNNKG